MFAASWLHDSVHVPKNSPGRPRSSRLAADAARRFLAEEGWDATEIDRIHHAIEAHSFTANVPTASLEAEVVQDADRLDALGAHGLARCLMLAGSWGSGLAHPTDPWGASREFDDNHWAVDHFFVKLLGLPKTMKTASGQAEAVRRAEMLRGFLRELAREKGIPGPDLERL